MNNVKLSTVRVTRDVDCIIATDNGDPLLVGADVKIQYLNDDGTEETVCGRLDLIGRAKLIIRQGTSVRRYFKYESIVSITSHYE